MTLEFRVSGETGQMSEREGQCRRDGGIERVEAFHRIRCRLGTPVTDEIGYGSCHADGYS